MPGHEVKQSPGVFDEHRARPVTESRPKFERLSRDPQLAIKQLAARIRFLILFLSDDGESMRMQEVKRGLHAYRYANFDDAIRVLVQNKQIVIHKTRGRVFRIILRQDRRTKLARSLRFSAQEEKEAQSSTHGVVL